jgi:hypothetical protein
VLRFEFADRDITKEWKKGEGGAEGAAEEDLPVKGR